MKKIIWILIVVLLLIIISSCVQKGTENLEITPTSTVQTEVTQNVEVGLKVTSLPTPLAMTDEERLNFVGELMRANDNCKLPCFWGIIPGETPWYEVADFLIAMNIEVNVEKFHHLGEIGFSEIYIPFGVYFEEVNDVVENINLGGEGYSNPDEFALLWKDYYPYEILNDYGKPSQVFIETRAESRGDGHGYNLWMAYQQYGFVIVYSDQLVEKNDSLRICPQSEGGKHNLKIGVHIQNPNNSDSLTRTNSVPERISFERSKDIQEAAGITPDEFYQLFLDTTQDDGEFCLESPKDIWP